MKQTEEEVTLDQGSKFSFRGYEVGSLGEDVTGTDDTGFSKRYEAAMFVVPVWSTQSISCVFITRLCEGVKGLVCY